MANTVQSFQPVGGNVWSAVVTVDTQGTLAVCASGTIVDIYAILYGPWIAATTPVANIALENAAGDELCRVKCATVANESPLRLDGVNGLTVRVFSNNLTDTSTITILLRHRSGTAITPV